MVYVPTCLVGPGLVRHSLVPDLLRPALAHHGLEPGLASLRASLDHLRVGLGPGLDHHGLDPGIYWRFQLGSAGDSSKSPPSPPRLSMSWWSLPSSDLPRFSLGSNVNIILQKIFHRIYFVADLFLPNSPRSSLHPNNSNRINKRLTALPNAKSTLSSVPTMETLIAFAECMPKREPKSVVAVTPYQC